ncbi:MAG: FAD-dependent thymidylate synthase [Acidimicrobiia bacterium]|nr:FAD-dependent thymidylate synthase [Acidimicrobiia bacterium]
MLARVRRLSAQERVDLLRAYVGERANRRHRPGRAFERVSYRFDVLGDYGAFRDLQRHRMLTVEWQTLSPRHGYDVPDAVHEAGLARPFEEAMERSAELHDALADRFPVEAPYAVALAYRLRFVMQMNAREAMHVLELRTSPQGHPSYRRICQEMHRLIAEEAGHPAIAEAMRHVDHGTYDLERLASERTAARRRTGGRRTGGRRTGDRRTGPSGERR